MEAMPCWPQLFIQPLILIAISLLYKNSGYSSSITSLNASAVLVLLLIPRLQVSVPGQLVTSATEPKPAAAKPSSSKTLYTYCLLYTSDAADERSSVDLGGRRI